MNEAIAQTLAESPTREWCFWLLSNVPGLPPISQAIHILGVATVMASVVIIDLRLLGLAVPSQEPAEMLRKLMPWTWWALLVNVVTGMPYLLANPYRYFLNPVFGWKMAFLAPALALALVVWALNRRRPGFWTSSSARLWAARGIAVASLALWTGVILAGRWIAYSDYLFWQE